MSMITLPKGTKVELRETTGFDEILVTKMLGARFTANPAGALLYRMTMCATSIVSIDDAPVDRPSKVEDVEIFWSKFTSKEKAYIEKEYSRLNEVTANDEELKN